jgi:toxin ParE1/3/4
VTGRYVLRPKAQQELDDQAYYLAMEANPDVGRRFLVAAHATLALLANQPEMGWRFRLKRPALAELRAFRVKGFERMLVLYLPRADGVDVLRVVHGSRNLQALFG